MGLTLDAEEYCFGLLMSCAFNVWSAEVSGRVES